MFIITLFFWTIAILLLYLKYRIIFNGYKVKGEIVGHMKAARSTFGFVGYNYRIRFEYNDEVIYANSIQSNIGTNHFISNKHIDEFHIIHVIQNKFT